MNRPIRIYTVCHYVLSLQLLPFYSNRCVQVTKWESLFQKLRVERVKIVILTYSLFPDLREAHIVKQSRAHLGMFCIVMSNFRGWLKPTSSVEKAFEIGVIPWNNCAWTAQAYKQIFYDTCCFDQVGKIQKRINLSTHVDSEKTVDEHSQIN